MPEEKRKINCWIPLSLYNKIESSGYENTTQAIITALKRLFEDTKGDTKGYNENTEGYHQDIGALKAENTQLKEDISEYHKDIIGYKQDIEGSKKDLERIQKGYEQNIAEYKENIRALNTEIARLRESLANSPDLVELVEVRAHFSGLQKLLEEKDKRIEDLTREVGTLNGFAHYFKNVEVKQIEAPAVEKVKPWWQFW
jgi:predicted RNase H-like nuclease (RuvC/YqgF family)